MPKKGFTLIELLVVITLISILSAIGVVSYRDLTREGRDSKRQTDLKILQSSLEQYRVDNDYYPATLAMQTALDNGEAFTSEVGARDGATGTMKTYLNQLPKETMTTFKYCYLAVPVNCDNSVENLCTSYNLYARLDNPAADSPSYTCGGVTYNLQVTLP